MKNGIVSQLLTDGIFCAAKKKLMKNYVRVSKICDKENDNKN